MLRTAASLSLLLWSIGCGSNSTTPVATQPPLSAEDKTAYLLEDISKVELSISRAQLHYMKLEIFTRERGMADEHTKYLGAQHAMEAMLSDVRDLQEAVYSHSDYKHPNLSEIRHDEVDHVAILQQLATLKARYDAYEESLRERRSE